MDHGVHERRPGGVTNARPFRLTYRINRFDGAERWVFEQGIGIFGPGGKLVALEGFITDITERIRAEETLRESEEKYRITTENATDIIWRIDLRGRFAVVSPSVERILGYSLKEIQSMRFRDVVTPRSYKHASLTIEERLVLDSREKDPTYQPVVLELEYVRKDGCTVWCEVTTKFLKDEKGRTIGITGITRDITSRKEVEWNLLKEKNFSETVINSLPSVFYVFDSRGSLVRWNNNLEALTGYSSEEMPAMRAFDFFPDDEKGTIKDLIQEVFIKGRYFVEADILTKSGKKIPHFFTGVGGKLPLVDPGTMHSRGVIHEHYAMSDGILAVSGEHMLRNAQNLKFYSGVFMTAAFISNFESLRDNWVATAIFTGKNETQAWNARHRSIQEICRAFKCKKFLDRSPFD